MRPREFGDLGMNKHSYFSAKTVAAASLSTLLLTSCVSGNDDNGGGNNQSGGGDGSDNGGGGSSSSSPLASTEDLWIPGDGKLDINSLNRVDEDTVVLNYSITNNSRDGLRTRVLLNGEGADRSTSGVSLIDTENQKQHFPWNSQESACYCSEISEKHISPGDTMDFWSAFPAPPKEVTSVSVFTPISPPLHGVEISDGGEEPGNAPSSLSDPVILDISGFSEELESGTSREDSGDETSVMLSSDVLFDLNESTLKDEAQEILEQVAEEIDNSSAETVQIDGHTDDSGNDSINIPLSEDRAEAVETELDELVTRSGVSFKTAGHGSEQPVANNDTEEGAQKNRRVSITFEK